MESALLVTSDDRARVHGPAHRRAVMLSPNGDVIFDHRPNAASRLSGALRPDRLTMPLHSGPAKHRDDHACITLVELGSQGCWVPGDPA
jgi:hypothetical protein